VELERALLERARAGDQDAFAQLASRHREAIYRAAYWILRDTDEALDATQEALLKAYRYLDRFEERASFRTWVRRIASNAALDRVARRKRAAAAALPEVELADPSARRADDQVEREERRRLVREAIDALPEAARAAVVLRDVEGLSYAEIASALGVPKGTVMSRIHHGRQLLRRKLAAQLGPRADALRRSREVTA
jgi:RNA polymerase sigma-70 factor (ECF subfamily)